MAIDTRAWMVVLSAFLCRVIDYGTGKSFGVLLPALTDQFDIMVWRVGNVVSLSTAVGTVVAVLISPIGKCIHLRYVIMFFGVMTASGFVFVAFAKEWVTISCLLILLCGIGIRCSTTFTISLLPDYFPQHLLFASGIVFSGASVGPMIFAPLTQFWLDTYGWRSTVLLIGATCFNLILCGILIRPIKSGYAKLDNPPKDKSIDEISCSSIPRKMIDLFDLRLFRNYTFLALLVTDFVVWLAWQAWVLYLIPYAEQKGMTPYEATTLVSVGSIAFPISMCIPALLVDSGMIRDSHVRVIGLLVCGASFTVSPWVNSLIGQIIITLPCIAAIGLCYITSMSIANTVKVENFAQVIAFEVAATSVGRYVGGTITGLLYDLSGTYDTSFLFVGGCQFAGATIQGLAIVFE